jgi:Holliday junction DNA helicase RuvB
MLARTRNGRVATAAAWDHLGLTAPNGSPGGQSLLFTDLPGE